MPSHFIFRAVGLPTDATPSDFEELRRFLTYGEELNLVKDSVTIVPSCLDDDTLTGLFGVKPPLPKFLENLKTGSRESFEFVLRDEDVSIDLNFFGFTQMYKPKEPIKADIIAVPGLNGHAYGSWKGKGDLQRMWIRDFLSKNFPNCRTMIYGYNASLQSKAIHTVLDYSRKFLEELKDIRKSKEEKRRPLIFIGHSFGGIVIAHTLVLAKYEREEESDQILKSTSSILFFGTPHRGMLIGNLLDALEKSGHHQRKELLDSIEQNSKALEAKLRHFINMCDQFRIYSFYETKQTPEVVVDEGGVWKRGGIYATAVQDKSALLQLPDSLEKPIPVEADHSNLVKFENPQDATYRRVRRIIGEILQEAPKEVANRFCTEAEKVFMQAIESGKPLRASIDLNQPD